MESKLWAVICYGILFIFIFGMRASAKNVDNTLDFQYEENENGEVKIVNYQGSSINVIVPETIDGKTVTQIGTKAFAKCNWIKKVTLPKSITRIDDMAFIVCEKLEKINLPSGLIYLGKGAFLGCSSLKRIQIPSSLTELNDTTFFACIQLKKALLPSSITKIGKSTFAFCKKMEVTMPDAITELGTYAFFQCNKFKRIILPTTLTCIGEKAVGFKMKSWFKAKKIKNVIFYCSNDSVAKKYIDENRFLQIDLHQHTYVVQKVKKAGCMIPGIEIDICTGCGAINTKILPNTGHDYKKDKVISPTTEERGYTIYRCTKCKDTQIKDYVPKLKEEKKKTKKIEKKKKSEKAKKTVKKKSSEKAKKTAKKKKSEKIKKIVKKKKSEKTEKKKKS